MKNHITRQYILERFRRSMMLLKSSKGHQKAKILQDVANLRIMLLAQYFGAEFCKYTIVKLPDKYDSLGYHFVRSDRSDFTKVQRLANMLNFSSDFVRKNDTSEQYEKAIVSFKRLSRNMKRIDDEDWDAYWKADVHRLKMNEAYQKHRLSTRSNANWERVKLLVPEIGK